MRTLLVALLSLALAGCAGLNKDLVQFDRLSDCPRQTPVKLIAAQDQFGPLTETHSLSCALEYARHSGDPALRASSIGSRLCFHLAERETDPSRRERLAAEGVTFAETAIAKGGDGDGAVHYFLAANLGLAVRDHLTLAVENLGRLESEMKRALELSPDIEGGGPMRLLGMLYLKAPAWPNGIGDGDKAYDLLEQAVNKYPYHPLNHLFFAQAIWDRSEDSEIGKVREEYAAGLQLLENGDWGYNRASWMKEFDQFKQEIGEAGSERERSLARAN